MAKVRWKLLLIPLGFYLVAALLVTVTHVAWGVPAEGKRPMIGGLREGAPAARAGLQVGDLIVAIDGRPVEITEVATAVDRGGDQIEVVVLREGERRSFTVVPIRDRDARRIGIEIWPAEEYQPASPGVALWEGLQFPVRYARFALHSYREVLFGRAKAEFSGPVGIVKVMAKHGSSAGRSLLSLVAILIVYLGMLSLLVVPVLLWVTRRR